MKTIVMQKNESKTMKTKIGLLPRLGILLAAFSLAVVLPLGSAQADSCAGKGCTGGGTARENIMLDSYIRENSIRKNDPVYTMCVNLILNKVGYRMNPLANRLKAISASQRMLLVKKEELLKAVNGETDIIHEEGDELVAATPKDGTTSWVVREFYENPKLQKGNRKCDAILHEIVVADYLREARPPINLTKMKSTILAVTTLLGDLLDDNNNIINEKALQLALLRNDYPNVGLTNLQIIELGYEIFDYLNIVNNIVCKEPISDKTMLPKHLQLSSRYTVLKARRESSLMHNEVYALLYTELSGLSNPATLDETTNSFWEIGEGFGSAIDGTLIVKGHETFYCSHVNQIFKSPYFQTKNAGIYNPYFNKKDLGQKEGTDKAD